MTLKRKPASEDLTENSPSGDEEDSDFELGLLDDELSSDDEDPDDSGDETENESGDNSDADKPEEDDEIFSTSLSNLGKTNGVNESEENLLSDMSSEFYSSDDDVVVVDA